MRVLFRVLRRILRIVAWTLLGLVVLVAVVLAGGYVFLNTQGGQNFAAHEIGSLSGGMVKITGLGGHFPDHLTAKKIVVADAKGPYATVDDAVLRWSPVALIHHRLHVEKLAAKSIDVTRLPQSSKAKTAKPSSSGGGGGLPIHAARIDDISVGRLHLAKAVAGHEAALSIHGHATADLPAQVKLALRVKSLDQPADLHLDATLDSAHVTAKLDLREPPGGLIAAVAKLPADLATKPIAVTGTLDGPRDDAALALHASVGGMAARAKGKLDLAPKTPGADLTLTIPDLAPYAALAGKGLKGKAVAGSTVLRLVAKKHKDGAITAHVDDTLHVTKAPGRIATMLGKSPHLAADATIAHRVVHLHRFHLTTKAATADLSGTLSAQQLALAGTLHEPDVALIDPALSGHAEQHVQVTGAPKDLTLKLAVDGAIEAKSLAKQGVSTGPFHLDIDLADLPAAPKGTVTGHGMLDKAKLAIDAAIARTKGGTTHVALKTLSWKSLSGHGAVTAAPGKPVPEGSLHLAIGHLADFARLANVKASGSISADFSNQAGAPAKLSVAVRDVREGRSIALRKGTIDATITHLPDNPAIDATASLEGVRAPQVAGRLDLTAKGTKQALAITAKGDFSNLGGKKAKLALDGTADIAAERVTLAHLSGRARGVALKLLRPATIAAKPGISVHNLRLEARGYGGHGTIAADGTVTPALAMTANIAHLPAAIARAAMPSLHPKGTIDATADIKGSLAKPTGTVTLNGRGLGVAQGQGAGLPPARIIARETLHGTKMHGKVKVSMGAATISAAGTAPLSMAGGMDLTVRLAGLDAKLVHAIMPSISARGTLSGRARLTGTPKAPRGTIDLAARGLRLLSGPAAALPPIDLTAKETLHGKAMQGRVRMQAGKLADLTLAGTAPLSTTGRMNLTLKGKADLKLIDPITEAQGTRIEGTITPDLHLHGTARAPQASGDLRLTGGSVQNVTSGLHLKAISAHVTAAGKQLTLAQLSAKAGSGTITGHGTVGLAPPMPLNLTIDFNKASPITSDMITEVLGGHVALGGAVKTGMSVGGTINIDKANINVPKGLPPSVQKIHIIRPGEKPPAASVPGPPVRLDLTIVAKNQVFVRGDGIFANLGGRLHLGGTSAQPVPSGGFHLIRGHFNLAGKQLKFTKGTFAFNGNGFLPRIDLKATNTASDGVTSTLAVTGSPQKPKIALSSSPTLPQDEILSHLLYNTGTQNLSALQAASLAASVAQLAGIGGGGPSPLGTVRNALGLDELSIGGGKGAGLAPTVNAGRYVAPGVYVGASQSANGQGTSANVQINIFKGLKLKSSVSTGSNSSSGNSESIGLTYQFNY